MITLLTPSDTSTPISKKDACALLNIAYNTTRLQRIIDDYNERQAFIQKKKNENKGKPATDHEIATMVEEYLSGETYAAIARRLYRSSSFVRSVLERIGVPQRPQSSHERRPDYIPDGCVSQDFSSGEIVWAARYHKPAIVKKEVQSKGDHLGKVYLIYVMEATDASDSFFPYVEHGGYFAYQPAYDLGKLEHLQKYGVKFSEI